MWKKGRSQRGGAIRGKWNQVNHVAPTGEVPVADLQALEEFKSKLKISEESSSSQGSSKANSFLSLPKVWNLRLILPQPNLDLGLLIPELLTT
jgi:hypothetical protein